MSEPDESPRRVRVPTRCDVFGRPTGFIDADAGAAGHWDETCWSDRPPS